MAEHVDAPLGEIHIAHNYSYADAATREAATSFVSADLGKIAQQVDNLSYWVLVATTPVWVRMTLGAIVNAQTGTSYTFLAKDRAKLVTHTNASATADTLPVASTTGFGADWYCWVQNRGAGAVTITPTTSTVDGAATLVLNQNEGALIVSDGTNYFTFRGKVASAGLSATLTVDTVNAPVFAADAGANDTYTATLSPAPSAYVTGNHYRFKANTANTGAATINFNALGAKTIVKAAGGITTALADNDIRAGQWVDLVYDGTNMQMQSATGNANSVALGANVATFLATPSSANLIAALTDETGTGAAVFATSPTLATPLLGTPTSGALTNCTADGTDAVGFRNIPQNSKSAAYTTVLADSGKHIYHPGADTTARVWTIDSNANVAYPIGTAITFVNDTSGGVITIAITSDTLVLAGAGTTGSRTLAANGVATAIKVTSTRWIISGTGLT